MSNYKYVFNPISGQLDKVYDVSLLTIKGAVATTANLPLTGNTHGDLYVVKNAEVAGDNKLYTWNKDSSTGLITDWEEIGDISSLDWSAITNKPSSSVANIDDAVGKRHTQGTDTALGTQVENLDMGDFSLENVDTLYEKTNALKVRNISGGTLVKGTCVYVTGEAVNLTTVETCNPLDKDTMPAIGVILADIANNQNGYIINAGILRMATDGFAGAVKARVYVQSDGSLDTTEPTSGSVQRMGILAKKASGSGGVISVSIRGRKSIYAAADEHPIIRMGSDVGHTKVGFHKYDNTEMAYIDKDGIMKIVSLTDGTYSATIADLKDAVDKKHDGSTQDTAIGLNTAKNTNVSTSLSAGTINATTYGISSDGGVDDLVLPEANTSQAGLLGADKWDEIVANSLHVADNSQAHSDYVLNNTDDIMNGSLTIRKANATTIAYIETYDEDNSNYSQLILRKSANETLGSLTQTADTEILGTISIQGVDDALGFSEGFKLTATQDGAIGSYTPTTVKMETYAVGGINHAQFVLDQDKSVMLGNATYNAGSFKLINGAQTGDPQVEMSLSADNLGHFTIATDTGNIVLNPAGKVDINGNNIDNVGIIYGNSTYARIGDAGTTSHSLASEDDLMVTGKLEAKGYVYIDGGLVLTGAFRWESSTATMGYKMSYWVAGIDDGLRIGLWDTDDAGGNQNLILTSYSNKDKDHDHDTLSANPTFFFQDATDPDISNNKWGSTHHNGDDFEINTGALTGAGSVPATITNDLYLNPTGAVKLGSALIGSNEAITATSETVVASLATINTDITTNGDSDEDNVSLANGTVGQIKIFAICAVGNVADSVKITPATMVGGTQITFAANPLGLGCILKYSASGWVVVGNNGGTIS